MTSTTPRVAEIVHGVYVGSCEAVPPILVPHQDTTENYDPQPIWFNAILSIGSFNEDLDAERERFEAALGVECGSRARDRVVIDILDTEETDILGWVLRAAAWIHAQVRAPMCGEGSSTVDGGGSVAQRRVLVHCVAGESRSVTFTLAYLLLIGTFADLDSAMKFLSDKYSFGNPNPGFLRQLRVLEAAVSGSGDMVTGGDTLWKSLNLPERQINIGVNPREIPWESTPLFRILLNLNTASIRCYKCRYDLASNKNGEVDNGGPWVQSLHGIVKTKNEHGSHCQMNSVILTNGKKSLSSLTSKLYNSIVSKNDGNLIKDIGELIENEIQDEYDHALSSFNCPKCNCKLGTVIHSGGNLCMLCNQEIGSSSNNGSQPVALVTVPRSKLDIKYHFFQF